MSEGVAAARIAGCSIAMDTVAVGAFAVGAVAVGAVAVGAVALCTALAETRPRAGASGAANGDRGTCPCCAPVAGLRAASAETEVLGALGPEVISPSHAAEEAPLLPLQAARLRPRAWP